MPYPIHRVLREEGDEAEFNRRLDKLQEENLRRLQIMEEICARLEFAELVKYSSRFTHHSDVGGRLNLEYQTDRLVTYLALTTLDMIAREQFAGHDFLGFPAWLSSRLKNPNLPPAITSLIEALASARDASVLDVLQKTFPAIGEAYYAEEGVSRLFKRLLCETIEPWMREWLCSVYFLAKKVPFRDTIRPSSLPWAHLPSREQVILFADYLFSLRNLHTHTSKHADTQELGQFRGPTRDSPSFSIRYSDVPDAITDKVEWFVALRSDLAESEVVRMISVHLLRKWLGYRDEASFIGTYLSRLTFRFCTYSLDHELVYNSNAIGKWALVQSRLTLLNHFDLPSMLLATASATRLVDLRVSPARYRPFLQEQLPKYLELTSHLNNRVQEAFADATSTEADGWKADQLIRSRVRELAASPEATNLLRMIDELRQSIDQTLAIPFY